MSKRYGCIAAWLLLFGVGAVRADGTLTHLSGAVSVIKAGGAAQAAVPGAKVAGGDTVVTGAGGYARIETTDSGEMVLRPETRLEIKSYQFAAAKPEEDNFVFAVLKGGLRVVTGLIGKRGNRDAYRLETPTATIGIRGTQFDMRVCQANCGALGDGTYVAVRFGAVHAANDHGGLDIHAGQVAHAAGQHAPVLLPRDPGVGFTPPPSIPKPDEKKKHGAPAAEHAPPAGSTQPPAPSASAGNGQECTVE